ncbi:MAG: hypothetical protein IPK26_30360 [Planctomycetes bacterium]|nr:hypothetical protein [Planctomycetota bacterium]
MGGNAPFGGRQYVDPDSGIRGIHAYVLPVAGASVTLPIPCTSAILCGQVVFARAFQLDPGAAGGMSLTRGLRLTVGN